MARLNEYDHDDVVGGRLKQQLHNQELLGHAGARELLREIDGLIGERSTKRRERANVITLSDLIQSESIERIDLLKIDVEGAELEVLDGIADDHWNCIDQIVLEVENDSPDRLTLESVRNTLEARGYHVVVDVDPFLAGTELYNVYGWRDSRRQRRAGFDPGRRRATVVFPEMLRERVGACLPSYMVPAAIIPLDAFPLTPNGKIDRRALPLYAPKLRSEGLRTWSMPTEVALRQLFADALGVSDIGLHEDFFAMGGHSLLAVQVVNRARSSLGVELTIGALFEYPTVAQLAASIASQQKALDPLHHILPLRRQGTGAPLFCLPPAGGLGWRYAGLLSVIDDRPLYCLQVKGIGDETSFPGTVSAFAADYVKDIRQIQAEGPYHLLGWSFGGIVAHAVACQLQREGELVALLALVDAYPHPPEAELDDATIAARKQKLYASLMSNRPAEISQRNAERMIELICHVANLRDEHVFDVFDGDVVLFAAPAFRALSTQWQPYATGQIKTHDIVCEHHEMTLPRPIRSIGELLQKYLASGSVS